MVVIGMNLPVKDKASISFAKGLYNGLGEGKTFEAAYNDAMIVLETEHPDYAEVVEVWKTAKSWIYKFMLRKRQSSSPLS